MPQLSFESRIAKDTNRVIDRIVDGEALLIQLNTGDYYSLNEVGTLIWESMDGAKTIEELASAIAAEYNVSSSQVRTDVLKLAQDMADEGLIALARST